MATINKDYVVDTVRYGDIGDALYVTWVDDDTIQIQNRQNDTLDFDIDDIPHIIELLKLMLPINLVVAPKGE